MIKLGFFFKSEIFTLNGRVSTLAEGAIKVENSLKDFKEHAEKYFVEVGDLAEVKSGLQSSMTEMRGDLREAIGTMSDVRDSAIRLEAKLFPDNPKPVPPPGVGPRRRERDMTPVYQTIHALPGANCVQASTASLLNLPLDEVPNFMLEGHPAWFHAWYAWLESRGYQVLQYRPDWTPKGLYLAFGNAGADNGEHAVVMRGGLLAHDPAGPCARGLSTIDTIYVLLPLDPAPKQGIRS